METLESTKFQNPKFGECTVKEVKGKTVVVTTEDGEEKTLLKSFIEKVAGPLKEIDINWTGNGYFELTTSGKTVKGKVDTKTGFKKYEPSVKIIDTNVSTEEAIELVKGCIPEGETSIIS